MLSRRTKIFVIGALLVITAITGGVAAILGARLHELDTYKEQILTEALKTINRQVTYEKGDATIRLVPSFTFTKVVIRERDGVSTFATAERVSFNLALLPLLKGNVIIRKLAIESPRLTIVREKDGKLNVSDLLEGPKGGEQLRLRGIRISGGSVNFTDRAATPEGVVISLENTDLELDRITRGKDTDFSLSTFIKEGANRSELAIRGSVRLPKQDRPVNETRLVAKIHGKNVDGGYYWPYYGRFVPFKRPAGRLDLDASIKGTPGEFTSKGTVRLAGLRLDYPQVFHAVLTPKDLQLHYEMKRDHKEVNVSEVDFRMDGLSLKGSCAIKDIDTKDPRIVARAAIAPFKLERFFQYIPFGIIATDTSQFIERYLKAGTYRLDEGKLDGRVSQILHMEKDPNYNVLSVKARVLEGGVVDIGNGVPTFNSIKGELELSGKNFLLKNMSGKFGTSPIAMNGMITDYPIDTPSAYPFSAVITPNQPDIAWLIGKLTENKLSFSGPSTLTLNGEGYTSGYTFTGGWNLNGAAYSMTNVIAKPANLANQLTFRLALSKRGLDSFSCQYNLPPLSLAYSSRHMPGRDIPYLIEAKTNQFDLASIAPLLPRAKKYLPQGKMQLTARGAGETDSYADLDWSGEANLSSASFKPSGDMKPLRNISGTVRFMGKNLETQRLTAMLGDSLLSGKGSITDFSNPSFNVEFTSPSLDVTDLGLRSPSGPLSLQQVQGNLSLQNDTLRIKSLAAHVNNSNFSLKGTVTNLATPRIDVSVTSSFLDADDVRLIAGLERPGNTAGKQPSINLKATITAEAGTFRKFPFKKLQTTTQYEDRILYFQPFELLAFGGKVSGRVRTDLGINGSPRYQTNLKVDKVSAEHLVQALNLRLHNEIITGTLSLQADVTAKGESVADLKKSLLGNVKLTLEEGKLRQFSTLSKVFSILNVSQLFSFRLPDMVSDGMPYNSIKGTLALKDGTVSTTDLFIDSNAMNISTVGKIDLIKEEIDATIGVQPLQTVDKLVNRIPIVGWILTGKDKHLISAYFEAKGKITDPTVTAIPVKSMAKGVFDMFKRVFQLPAKLFTDTGEVIIGK
ncbi:MAG: DUF748 domain-containing protein [Desulfuromonadales bacterium]|nr:MAG: DUF748 domain-containing protein [Desulfuromonadales bacterium]